MNVAGLLLLRWVVEAEARLPGMKCRRLLYYPETPALVIHLTGKRDRFLMLPNGTTAPFPCIFANKEQLEILRGARQTTEKFNFLRSRSLLRIAGYPGDRRVALFFGPRPGKSGDGNVALIIHMMGARPLCLLVDDAGKILTSDRQSSRFPVGGMYSPPSPPTLANLLTMTFPDFLALMRSEGDKSLTEILCQQVWGIDEELAGVLTLKINTAAWRASASDRVIWTSFSSIKSRVRDFLSVSTRLIADPGSGKLVDIVRQPSERSGGSINELWQLRLTQSLRETGIDDTREIWRKFAATQLKKVKRAETALKTRQEKADKAESYKKYADILGIHRSRIGRGLERVELPDPYAENRRTTIELDPAKSVQGNIESYYKQHRRALSARSALAGERTRLAEIRMLAEEIAEFIEGAHPEQQPYPIVQWQERLEKVGIAQPRTGPSARRQPAPRRRPYWEFTLAGGEIIRVGRSARDNDELTLKRTAKTDWFLHARQSKGAHVILRHGQATAPPSKKTLRQAAEAAAFFSEARKSSVVPVAYTPIKYVRKPRKAPPGLVSLLQEETIMVEPSPPPGYHARKN